MKSGFESISDMALANVSGGTTPTTGTSSGSGSSTNDQLLTAVQGIQGSLKDLGSHQNQGLFGGTNGLMFMTMALAMQRRNNNVVVVNGGGRGSYYWHAGW